MGSASTFPANVRIRGDRRLIDEEDLTLVWVHADSGVDDRDDE
jgi:hypothetical protein